MPDELQAPHHGWVGDWSHPCTVDDRDNKERTMSTLQGKKIAILATDGFEEDELLRPLHALEAAGAQVDVVSPAGGWIKGWKHGDWGEEVAVDVELHHARTDEYDALVLPGGVMSPDKLRVTPAAVVFVKHFVDAKKPIAAICHGPWTLIEAGGVSGHKLTSWGSLRSDLVNAGAEWVDEECVVDDGLITSRYPDDLTAFNEKMVAEFARSAARRRAPAAASRAPAPS
jgi:protease I